MIHVEIWSDIRCPFCYLGKRRFEAGLQMFGEKDLVTVEWHSFQLDPSLVTQPGKKVIAHLAEVKGISRDESIRAHEQITIQGQREGILFNFDNAVVANSFHAHRLTHLAKTYHVQDTAEDLLFRAYFSEGKDISDIQTLVNIAVEAGIPEHVAQEVMSGEEYSDNVLMDENYAREMGIHAVPYFLFNGSIAVRGAQPAETFLRALEQSHAMLSSPDTTGNKIRSFLLRKL